MNKHKVAYQIALLFTIAISLLAWVWSFSSPPDHIPYTKIHFPLSDTIMMSDDYTIDTVYTDEYIKPVFDEVNYIRAITTYSDTTVSSKLVYYIPMSIDDLVDHSKI